MQCEIQKKKVVKNKDNREQLMLNQDNNADQKLEETYNFWTVE